MNMKSNLAHEPLQPQGEVELLQHSTSKGVIKLELSKRIQKVKALAMIFAREPSLRNSYQLKLAENEIINFVLGGV